MQVVIPTKVTPSVGSRGPFSVSILRECRDQTTQPALAAMASTMDGVEPILTKPGQSEAAGYGLVHMLTGSVGCILENAGEWQSSMMAGIRPTYLPRDKEPSVSGRHTVKEDGTSGPMATTAEASTTEGFG